MSDPVQATIWHCLNNYAYEDAIFLAERLNSFQLDDAETPQRLHLLATCYFRSNNKLQCYELLKNHHKSINNLNYKCRFLLATAAADLNKLPESEQALLSGNKQLSNLDYLEKSYNELGCFALKLYGRICVMTERLTVAKEAFGRALKVNPFLFDGFESLCRLNKENLDVNGIFQTTHLSDKDLLSNCQGVVFSDNPPQPQPTQQPQPQGILINRNNMRNTNRCHRNLFTSTPNNNFFSPPSPSSSNQNHQLLTPTTTTTDTSSLLSPIIVESEPKPKKPCLRTVSSPQQPQWLIQNTSVRRSSRLYSNNQSPQQSPSLKENTTSKQQHKRQKKVDTESPRTGLDPLLLLLRDLGQATLHLTRYECKKALELLTSLKPHQQQTPFVIASIARAYFETGEHEQAVAHYNMLKKLNPTHPSLQYLSSSLWHLSRETELSVLSQELLSEPTNKQLSTTWIVLGNCFSVQKEHETAIKFFKRGIQVSPSAYAYTLLGHEYVNTDELDKALQCFRTSSRLDQSQYNCWYGIGIIYFKQERFKQAEQYYLKAVAINQYNSVLLCHLGVVQSSLNKPELSLKTFDRATELNRNDPLCKFHRASVLFAVGRLDEALEELEELQRIVPKESLVHFLMAKIHSKRGSTHKALLHFSWATDLDPKGANNHIKESIEPCLSNTL